MNGIIPLFKPRGMTSFQCVSKIRQILHLRKVGHSGTLDPDVDGVLPICVGSATKVSSNLMRFGKVYRGAMTLGVATTTEDLSGQVISISHLRRPFSGQRIDEGMRHLTSEHLVQVPPMYSAVRVNGRHLYEYARRGQKVRRPRRVVQVHYFKRLRPARFNAGRQFIDFEVSCGKGTYVRTLATDLGRQLGVPAVMAKLTRFQSGNFDLSQTVTFDQIKFDYAHQKISKFLFPIEHALPGVKHYDLPISLWKRVQHGAFLYPEDFPHPFRHVMLKYAGVDKALYQYDQRRHCYRPLKMFSIH